VYNSTNDDRITVLTDYVTTRWYRAPEVIVGWPRYTSAVDMWAVGCIVAELIGRTPLFPGADTMKQMELISKIMGKPDEQFIKRCRKTAYRFAVNVECLIFALIPSDLQVVFVLSSGHQVT
jgi:serine/threonine protein kinase